MFVLLHIIIARFATAALRIAVVTVLAAGGAATASGPQAVQWLAQVTGLNTVLPQSVVGAGASGANAFERTNTVIPANVGIQENRLYSALLDPRVREDDDEHSLAPAAAPTATSASLQRGYGLKVVPVPPVPPEQQAVIAAAAGQSPEQDGCPLEVRAIVIAETPQEEHGSEKKGASQSPRAFAIVALRSMAADGTMQSGDSHIVRRGDSLPSARGPISMGRLTPTFVTVRRGGSSFRCSLSSPSKHSSMKASKGSL